MKAMSKLSKVNYYFYSELISIDKKLSDDFLINIISENNTHKSFNRSSSLSNLSSLKEAYKKTNSCDNLQYYDSPLSVKKYNGSPEPYMQPIHNTSCDDDMLNEAINEVNKKSVFKSLIDICRNYDKYKPLIFTDAAHNVPKQIKKLILRDT
jgi:hypothetical protein